MNHIYNMDAFELMRNLENNSIPLQIHDIPYYIEPFKSSINNTSKGTGIIRDFGGWDMHNVDFKEFSKLCDKVATQNGSVLIFYNNWVFISDLIKELQKYFSVDILIWYKTNPKPQIRKRQFVLNHELIIYAKRGKYTLNFTNHADMYSVKMNSLALGKDRLKIINSDGSKSCAHPTQKPTKLIQYYIEKCSNPEDIILDSYAGVLTTAMAALRCNRQFIVNDLSKEYVSLGTNWIRHEFPNKEVTIHNEGEFN